jgi:hypothetical protein
MNTQKTGLGDFSVLQFSLTMGEDGRPFQRMTPLGTFFSVETAFALARRAAEKEKTRLQEALGEAGAEVVELLDTEWGYDVRRGWLTATRLWVHDAGATRPVVAE